VKFIIYYLYMRNLFSPSLLSGCNLLGVDRQQYSSAAIQYRLLPDENVRVTNNHRLSARDKSGGIVGRPCRAGMPLTCPSAGELEVDKHDENALLEDFSALFEEAVRLRFRNYRRAKAFAISNGTKYFYSTLSLTMWLKRVLVLN
jgi:hypothetical protein